MAKTASAKKKRMFWLGYIVGAALTIITGKLLLPPPERPVSETVEVEFREVTSKRLLGPVRHGLAGLSYDLPFLVGRSGPRDLVLVLLDRKVKVDLGQPPDEPLDRRFHTRLLERLTQEGAKLVLFDILFDQEHPDPVVDEQFAAAMRRHGRVVLVADYVKQFHGNIATYGPIPPAPALAQAAAGWGLGRVSPDPDFAIRKLDSGAEDFPAAGWIAASLLRAPAIESPQTRFSPRWVNYYCPPDGLSTVNFDHALQTDGLPQDFFRDKIVIVGSRPTVGTPGAEREEFANPYSRFGGQFSSGPAVHAFTILNLLRGDWLVRLDARKETALVLAWGFLISALLMRLRPWRAWGTAVLAGGLFTFLAAYLQIRHQLWFSWLVPAAVQTSVALVWSISFQYTVERRQQRRLRDAFSAYLSPYMAEQIANSDFDLSLGGKEVEATVMFADLEGFTRMSESLPPGEVSRILTAYFNQTTRFVLEQNATIIKYIGDAVLAAWGVPLPNARHAESAVTAAIAMSRASTLEVNGRVLRTRIGISTGIVLAGNLGSDFRFDYTVIGDTTNFASRLESLNKLLRTDILISETTHREISDNIRVRPLGKFLVVGKDRPVDVFEVLGLATDLGEKPPWLDDFSCALKHFASRDLDKAEALLHQVIQARGGRDGPSVFYLKQLAQFRVSGFPGEQWNGEIRLAEK